VFCHPASGKRCNMAAERLLARTRERILGGRVPFPADRLYESVIAEYCDFGSRLENALDVPARRQLEL
jgi:hypothetical protein